MITGCLSHMLVIITDYFRFLCANFAFVQLAQSSASVSWRYLEGVFQVYFVTGGSSVLLTRTPSKEQRFTSLPNSPLSK